MHHIVVKVTFFTIFWVPASYSYRFRINISMKKHRHLFSKLPIPFRINHGILTSSLKGKLPVFRAWTFGNFGYWLSVIAAWACPDFDQGDQHRKQRKMLNPVFSIAHMRKMGMYSSLLLHIPTHWCASPDILWCLLQGPPIHFYFAAS